MANAIWWVRRDLRLHDNRSLRAARAAADAVIPLFIIDRALQTSEWVSEKRRAFLLGGLRDLDAALRERGSYLLVRHGRPAAVLADLVAEIGADAVYAEADYSPYARRRDDAVRGHVPLKLVGGPAIRHPGEIEKASGGPYVVYTPYKNSWRQRPLPHAADLLPAPDAISTPENIANDGLPSAPALPDGVPFPPGETEARRRLMAFTQGDDAPIFAYKQQRNLPATDGTSRLSPYLRFGMVSAREAAVQALTAVARASDKQAREGAQTWLDELIWRDFYISVLYHNPHVRGGSFRPEYDRIVWRNDADEFDAWRNGRTGYPIVDAAMRQLQETGWMHNRARMIVASFLVKDLLIDWRWGERWFMQQLVDGDPAANNGGWQWAAGTGTDAAPYFRIFNPTTQGERFDKEGDYIRRWVPELRHVPDQFIHEPAQMTPLEQRNANCIIGEDYPRPIVDHKAARQRTLDAYKAAREG